MGLTQVSKDGVKNDAIDASKLPANSVGASELADNAVDTNSIQTQAVTTGKLANDAVDYGKLADSAVLASKLANNSVQTNKIVDEAVTLAKLEHGTSSNDGKFLRANNGADPSFESIPAGTTINNNADNRVITGSGTANTLNGESNVVIDANGKLGIGTTSPGLYDVTVYRSSGTSRGRFHTAGTSGNDYADLAVQAGSNYAQMFVYGTGQVYMTASAPATMSVGNVADSSLYLTTNNTIRQTITNNGNVGIGTLSPAKKLDVNGEIRASSGILFGSDTAAANALDDYEEGTFTPSLIYQNSSGLTLATNSASGKYTKIGRVVYILGYINWNVSGSPINDNIGFGGLPFATDTGGITAGSTRFIGNISLKNTNTQSVDHQVQPYGNNALLIIAENNQGNLADEIGSGSGFQARFQFWYHAS